MFEQRAIYLKALCCVVRANWVVAKKIKPDRWLMLASAVTRSLLQRRPFLELFYIQTNTTQEARCITCLFGVLYDAVINVCRSLVWAFHRAVFWVFLACMWISGRTCPSC